MKRLIILVLVIALSLSVLSSCSMSEKEYTLALGVKTTVTESTAKVSETVAAVLTDSEGKIVQCRIDVIDFSAGVDGEGKGIAKKPISKAEQGDDYGMVAYAQAPKGEWYQQARHFEEFITGMTLDEVKTVGIGSKGEATDSDLVAGCTIAVSDFVGAVVKAFESEHKYTFTARGKVTSAVSAVGSVDPVGDDLVFNFNTDFAAVVSARGRVVGTVIDSLEVSLGCETKEAEGGKKTVFASKVTNKGTKLEQGDSYGMVAWGHAPKGEWYTQARAYADSAIGYETKKLTNISDKEAAGCTIYAGGYKIALVKAADVVR